MLVETGTNSSWLSGQFLGFITVVLNKFKQLILICIPSSQCSPKLKKPKYTGVRKQGSFYQFFHENRRFFEVSEITEMGGFLFFIFFQKSQNL